MAVLHAHVAATCFLAGLIWVVQVVIYPNFRNVGRTATWQDFHAAHTKRIASVVAVPWAVHGITTVMLLVRPPEAASYWLVLVAAAAAAATVVTTVWPVAPLHARLYAQYDDATADRVVRTNWLRTAAWTVSAATGLALLAS